MDCFFVFIVAGARASTLRVGLTRNLSQRLAQLRADPPDAAPGVARLLYYELSEDAESACRRERQLRCWNRRRRERLIATMNPQWDDLCSKW